MLRIRPEQLEPFKPVAEAAFVRRVTAYVREKHGEVVIELPDGARAVKQLPDDALLEIVRSGIARARSYGMTWESTLTAFVAIMFVVAPNFDEHPLIQRVLKDESVPPDSRIDLLWERTTDQNWEAAQRNSNPASWNLESPEGEV
ncbi:MAG TPA: hypothetical protein VJH03_24030 [Blastocatellia bacterium]|nr:hypothetical protein [Blastocatellia bacterium]